MSLAAVGLALAVLCVACASQQHRSRAPAGGAATSSGAATSAPPGAATSAPPGGLIVKAFTPFAATGTLAVPVADQLSGYCWTGSIAVPKAGTYRCLVGNAIYDPCFAPPNQPSSSTVACVPDPWSAAHLVTLTKALPTSKPLASRTSPWALELANHVRCVAGTGTVPVVDGVSLSYVCGSGMAAGLVAGPVAQNGSHLTVKYGSPAGTTLAVVAVTTAWRG
ncbi:MAG: hypothetical protein QOH14_3186 [Pseudonocardiales bacterium]|nr:hypothetical protein [Pseudonocardiales bacterium]